MKKIITLLLILGLSSCYVYDSIVDRDHDDYYWRYEHYWYPNTFYYRPYSRTIVVVPRHKQKEESRPRIENPNPRPFNPQSRERQAPIRTFPKRY